MPASSWACAASGKEYDISEIHFFRIEDGKVAEHWRDADMLGMLRQLGALPEAREPVPGAAVGRGGGGGGGGGAASASISVTVRSSSATSSGG